MRDGGNRGRVECGRRVGGRASEGVQEEDKMGGVRREGGRAYLEFADFEQEQIDLSVAVEKLVNNEGRGVGRERMSQSQVVGGSKLSHAECLCLSLAT